MMIFLLLVMNLWARDVVIQSTDTSDISFERHLMQNPNLVSYVQFLETPEAVGDSALYGHLKSAQFHFLNGDLELAKDKFLMITRMQHQADWQEEQRKVIHFSFLRVAQLESDPQSRTALFDQALYFDDQIKIDTQVFPPPFVAAFQKRQEALQKRVWSLPPKAEDFQRILVNGRPVNKHSGLFKTYSKKMRVTFLSNKFKEVTFIGEPSALQNQRVAQVPLAEGPCGSPQFNIVRKQSARFIYFKDDCTEITANSSALAELTQAKSIKKVAGPAESEPAFYKNKWLWVGLSVVAAGLTYSHIQNANKTSGSNRPSQPTVQTFTN